MVTVEAWHRRVLLGASSATYLAAAIELALVEHWVGWTQWIPFVMIAAGLTVALGAWRRPSLPTFRSVQAVSALVVGGSLAGIVLHARGNALFAHEVRPDTTLGALAWEALSGGNPLLAPGMLALAAVLAAAAVWRHPAFDRS